MKFKTNQLIEAVQAAQKSANATSTVRYVISGKDRMLNVCEKSKAIKMLNNAECVLMQMCNPMVTA